MDLKKKLQKAVAGISICAMALSLIVVTVPADAAGKVKLNKTKLNMAAGNKKTIKVVGKKIKSIKWKSTKTKVASVKKRKCCYQSHSCNVRCFKEDIEM